LLPFLPPLTLSQGETRITSLLSPALNLPWFKLGRLNLIAYNRNLSAASAQYKHFIFICLDCAPPAFPDNLAKCGIARVETGQQNRRQNCLYENLLRRQKVVRQIPRIFHFASVHLHRPPDA
jgi:hypothetical protein